MLERSGAGGDLGVDRGLFPHPVFVGVAKPIAVEGAWFVLHAGCPDAAAENFEGVQGGTLSNGYDPLVSAAPSSAMANAPSVFSRDSASGRQNPLRRKGDALAPPLRHRGIIPEILTNMITLYTINSYPLCYMSGRKLGPFHHDHRIASTRMRFQRSSVAPSSTALPAAVELRAVTLVSGLCFDHEFARDGEPPRDHRYSEPPGTGRFLRRPVLRVQRQFDRFRRPPGTALGPGPAPGLWRGLGMRRPFRCREPGSLQHRKGENRGPAGKRRRDTGRCQRRGGEAKGKERLCGEGVARANKRCGPPDLQRRTGETLPFFGRARRRERSLRPLPCRRHRKTRHRAARASRADKTGRAAAWHPMIGRT